MTAPSIPPTAASPAQARFLAAVRDALPELRLLEDPTDRASYRTDETAYLVAGLPLAVALPTSTAEVSALVRLAAEHRIPIVPRGAGTGLSGGAAGIEGGITIAMTRMDAILEIDNANLVVVTQPGILNAELKRRVAAEGLYYAPDPASYEICSIGGNLGTNAGGLCCVKYGQTRDSVLGLEVVLADGRVIRTGGKNVKDVAGYALTHLFVGSQGTLGIITEATLRLPPAPPRAGSAPGDRGSRDQVRDPDRDVRPRRRRQSPPEPDLRARRPTGRGADRPRSRRPLPSRDRPRRDGHGRTRNRPRSTRRPRRAGRRRRHRRDALDQVRPRPARDHEPRPRDLNLGARVTRRA